jgi:ribonuclease Z
MELTFLGTSSGTPTKLRNVSALALQPENSKRWFLVDCGEGTQHQLLHTSLSLKTLAAICITHVHGDHCYGLPGLLASAAMSGRREPLVLIAPAPVHEFFRAVQQATDLYLPYELQFIDVGTLDSWACEHYVISKAVLSHRVPSWAYVFTEADSAAQLDMAKLQAEGIPQGQLWGQIKQGRDVEWQGGLLVAADYLLPAEKGRKLVVGGDNDTPELLTQACEDAQVLVHEATYTLDVAEKVGPDVQHCAAARIAEFAEAVALPNLVLTHFSPRYQENIAKPPFIADIGAEAAARYRGNLWLAEDFARYRLAKSKQFSVLSLPGISQS